MKISCTVVSLLTALLLPARAHGDNITLHPAADTGLFQAFPDNNLGLNGDMPIGATRVGAVGRGLMKFDFSQIPQNAVISAVTLQFQAVKEPAVQTPSTFNLHRMLVSWTEGTGTGSLGALAMTNESTWNSRFYPDTPWGSPGGTNQIDFSSTISGGIGVTGLGTYVIPSSAGMVADVQFWLTNTSANFGWMLKSDGETNDFTARRIASSQDTLNAPTLTVTFSAPETTPAQPQISGVSKVNNQIQFAFNAEANRTYAVEFRTQFDNANWQTLTNIPAQANPATIPVSDSISAGPRFYRIRTP